MKKRLAFVLILAILAMTVAACGNAGGQTGETTVTGDAPIVEQTLDDLIDQILTLQPVEFTGAVTRPDLSGTSEEARWELKNATGLDDAGLIADAAVFEPVISAIAFSLVVVRVEDGAETKAVAQAMQEGIDPRKWVCVEADDLLVAGFGDVVLLIMVDSASDMTAQSFVDACQEAVGMEPAFILK